MQKVTIQTDESCIVIDDVSKVEITMLFDMFSNDIKIFTPNGIRKFKQYEIINMIIEDVGEGR